MANHERSTGVLLKMGTQSWFLDTIQRFFAYFYLWQVQTVRCGSRDRRCRWCRCSPTHPSQLACYISRTHRKKVTILMHNFTLRTWRSSFSYLLHAVVHRQKRLESFPLQHIGELHVDRLHRSCVAHNPVLVQVWCIVITRSTKGTGERKDKMAECLHAVWFLLCHLGSDTKDYTTKGSFQMQRKFCSKRKWGKTAKRILSISVECYMM